MLQQILNDMYVDPDVLDGLNDDQKKTLFLKMRQEQVKRWKEREEKLETEGGNPGSRRTRPTKANSKSVSWLLGRDGDVSVIVIGEVDELRSRFICSAREEKKPSVLQNSCNQTILKSTKGPEDVRSETHTQPEASTLKLETKAAEEETSPQSPVCSGPPTRAGAVRVRPASANPTVGCINERPDPTDPRLEAAVSTSTSTSSTASSSTSSSTGSSGSAAASPSSSSQELQEGKGFDAAVYRQPDSAEAGTSRTAPACAGRGRVAQLMKNFSADTPTQAASRGIKPPLPTKPSHLRLTTR